MNNHYSNTWPSTHVLWFSADPSFSPLTSATPSSKALLLTSRDAESVEGPGEVSGCWSGISSSHLQIYSEILTAAGCACTGLMPRLFLHRCGKIVCGKIVWAWEYARMKTSQCKQYCTLSPVSDFCSSLNYFTILPITNHNIWHTWQDCITIN